MHILNIEILNPKAEGLLNELVKLDLISIKDSDPNKFVEAVTRIRANNSSSSLAEITEEVETIRSMRHAAKP